MLINTNISAQNTAGLLMQSSQQLSQSLARLSSGSKINSPADDAAGLAVSMNFNAQIGRTDAASNNVANATSFSQTQDGYLQQVGNALDRMSELAVQAQDVTKSDADRGLYNQEFQTLATYVNSVATKNFNGVALFSGTTLNVTSDSEGGTFAMKGISGSFLPSSQSASSVPMPSSTTVGDLLPSYDNITNDGFKLLWVGGSASGTGNPKSSTLSDVVNTLNSTFAFAGHGGSASYDSSTGQFSITLTAGTALTEIDSFNTPLPASNDILAALGFSTSELDNSAGGSSKTVTKTLTTSSGSSGSLDISSISGAQSALTAIKSAISNLASDRATVGANMERLNSTSQELSTLKNNLSAANSRITDVDVAQESTDYAKYNILVQTGTAMLAQANALPQSVLKLLG